MVFEQGRTVHDEFIQSPRLEFKAVGRICFEIYIWEGRMLLIASMKLYSHEYIMNREQIDVV